MTSDRSIATATGRICDFRMQLGLSADALAEVARLSAAEMLLVEEGSVDMTVRMIDSIADALNVHHSRRFMSIFMGNASCPRAVRARERNLVLCRSNP
jgi:transcriptional regulator with XRE-family HTH domain